MAQAKIDSKFVILHGNAGLHSFREVCDLFTMKASLCVFFSRYFETAADEAMWGTQKKQHQENPIMVSSSKW